MLLTGGFSKDRPVSPGPLDALSPVPLGAGRATPRLRAAALVRLSSYSRLPCHAQRKRSSALSWQRLPVAFVRQATRRVKVASIGKAAK